MLKPVASPASESTHIHLNIVAIGSMPTLHFDQQVHLPFTNQPSHFLPQPASSASLSSFDLQPQIQNPPQHMTIPTNTDCQSQMIHCFIHNQHQYQVLVCNFFSAIEHPSARVSTQVSQHASLFFTRFPSRFP